MSFATFAVFKPRLRRSFDYDTRQLEDGNTVVANQRAAKIHNEQQATLGIGELLLLYVYDTIPDGIRFSTVRRWAFARHSSAQQSSLSSCAI